MKKKFFTGIDLAHGGHIYVNKNSICYVEMQSADTTKMFLNGNQEPLIVKMNVLDLVEKIEADN